jgi:hypothetical protein
MNVGKLFKSLVITGVMLGAGGCKTTTPSPSEPTPAPESPATEAEVDCSTVCENWPATDAFCPDPNLDGNMNCCWLMGGDTHVCCDITE